MVTGNEFGSGERGWGSFISTKWRGENFPFCSPNPSLQLLTSPLSHRLGYMINVFLKNLVYIQSACPMFSIFIMLHKHSIENTRTSDMIVSNHLSL